MRSWRCGWLAEIETAASKLEVLERVNADSRTMYAFFQREARRKGGLRTPELSYFCYITHAMFVWCR